LRIAIVYEAAEHFLGVVETVSVRSVGGKKKKKKKKKKRLERGATFHRFSSGKN
jgi:hypothetical protein